MQVQEHFVAAWMMCSTYHQGLQQKHIQVLYLSPNTTN